MLKIECQDCYLLGVETDCRFQPGYCETCDYGSSYLSSFQLSFDVGEIRVEIIDDYEMLYSESDLMMYLVNACETFKQHKFHEIFDLLKKDFKEQEKVGRWVQVQQTEQPDTKGGEK